MDDHSSPDTPVYSVIQSGEAIQGLQTNGTKPRRKKNTSQFTVDNHGNGAGEGRARSGERAKELSPVPEIPADQRQEDTHTRSVSAEREATTGSKTIPITSRAKKGSRQHVENHPPRAPEISEAGQPENGHQFPDARFTDPLIMRVLECWRQRQDMVRAMNRLTLQSKAILRRLVGGEDLKKQKGEATALFNAVVKARGLSERLAKLSLGVKQSTPPSTTRSAIPSAKTILTLQIKLAALEELPKFTRAQLVIGPLLDARAPLEIYRKSLEKRLETMAADLPIAHMVENIRGIGYLGLAAITAEAGDLSCYRSWHAVWKRMGLAVIDGGRQRKVTGEAAFEHGYSPQKHAVIWAITDSLFKAQSGDEPEYYRVLYDEWKAEELLKTAEYTDKKTGKKEVKNLTAGHAHNRALRKVSKRLLKNMFQEWKRVA